jgi:hypothetical protein
VPSEEIDESSVVIPPTHIPQDQGSISGGSARSSDLSQGRFSWTWWQSFSKADDLSTARRFEIPEVKIKTKKQTESIQTFVDYTHVTHISFKRYEARLLVKNFQNFVPTTQKHPHSLIKHIN